MQAQQANAKLEAYWASLRVAHARLPGSATCLTPPITPASCAETKRNLAEIRFNKSSNPELLQS